MKTDNLRALKVGGRLSVDTPQGTIHIEVNQGVTKVCLFDHFDMAIMGRPKRWIELNLDTDEYPTGLRVRESERPWENLTVERQRFLHTFLKTKFRSAPIPDPVKNPSASKPPTGGS